MNHYPNSRKRRPDLYGSFVAGNAPILLEVVLRDGESVEELIRRFLRAFKKKKLGDEIRAHDRYEKPSDVRRRARERRKQVAQKINRQNNPSQD